MVTLSCLSPQILKCALTIPLRGAFFGGRPCALQGAEARRVSLGVMGSNPGTQEAASLPSALLSPATGAA